MRTLQGILHTHCLKTVFIHGYYYWYNYISSFSSHYLNSIIIQNLYTQLICIILTAHSFLELRYIPFHIPQIYTVLDLSSSVKFHKFW